MKQSSQTYRIIGVLIIGVLFIPLMINHLPGIPKAFVFGVEEQKENETVSWTNGTAQQAFEKHLMDNSVSRTYLLRFRNQYQYSLFSKINAGDIYVYNGNYFRFYIPAFNEDINFVGKDSIQKTLDALVKLQHQLGDSIPVVTIIPPCKNRYYSRDLPTKNKTKSNETNYYYTISGLKEKQLHFIDFNQYFMENKSEIPAIFAKGGIHWTHYAATVASDSLMRYINHIKGVKYDAFEFDTVYHDGFNVDDLDLALLRNILAKPKDERLRNVTVKPVKGQKRLNAVIVGDSYFLAIQNSGARKLMFTDNSNYHYYFNRTYNHKYEEIPFDIHEIKKAMQQADCILLINDITNLENFGFDFPQKISRLLESK